MTHHRQSSSCARVVAAVCVVMLFSGSVAAQSLLARWSFLSSQNSGTPRSGSSFASQITTGNFVKSSALSAYTAPNSFVANGWPGGSRQSTKYFGFSMTADGDHWVDYDRVDFDGVFMNTVLPGTLAFWEIRSSVDGYGSAVDSGVVNSVAITPFSADVSSLGSRGGTVSFRFYFYLGTGFSPTLRGLFGDVEVRGTVVPIPHRYPGTGEDLSTRYQIDQGPVTTVDSRFPVPLDVGDTVAVTHRSPGGTFVNGGQLIALASLTTTGSLVPSPFPGLHLDLSTAVVILANDFLGNPLTLPAGGAHYAFIYPGGLSGFTGVIQCMVVDQGAANGIFASSDALELVFD